MEDIDFDEHEEDYLHYRQKKVEEDNGLFEEDTGLFEEVEPQSKTIRISTKEAVKVNMIYIYNLYIKNLFTISFK